MWHAHAVATSARLVSRAHHRQHRKGCGSRITTHGPVSFSAYSRLGRIAEARKGVDLGRRGRRRRGVRRIGCQATGGGGRRQTLGSHFSESLNLTPHSTSSTQERIEVGVAERRTMHPTSVVGSARSQEDRRQEVSRGAPTSGRRNTTNVRQLPICTRARQGRATPHARKTLEITRAGKRSGRRSGTRHSKKKQKLCRAGEERPAG